MSSSLRAVLSIVCLVVAAASGLGNAYGEPSVLIQRLENGQQQTVVVYGTSLTAGGAWVSQIREVLDSQYPGQITWVNSGLSGKASNSGVANLQTHVLDKNADAVFIEFAMNDAFLAYEEGNVDKDISVVQARANLEAMVDTISQQNPQVEIVLQTMNPSWDAPNGNQSGSKRPLLADYFQMYREVAQERSLSLVDNHRVWQTLQTNDPNEFQSRVADGTHPDSTGYRHYVSSAVLYEMGANIGPSVVVDLHSGQSYLHNQSSTAAELIAYTISSPGGALRPDWSGLSALQPGVWQKANPTANYLSELTHGAPLTLAAGEVRDLGIVWNATARPHLRFQHQTPDGVLREGHVIFLNDTTSLTGVAGDYNGDGMVDAADYTVWRNSLGGNASAFARGSRDPFATGPVSEVDYSFWKSNFTALLAAASPLRASSVPEPRCLGFLTCCSLVGMLLWLR